MSILCDPNINEVIIGIDDFIAMIDHESYLKIYGNTNHELAKLLIKIATTYVIFITHYDRTTFNNGNNGVIVLLLSNNELYFVSINDDNTYIVNKIIPNTKLISKLKISKNKFYGRNEQNKIEIIHTDTLQFANRETSDAIDTELLKENNVYAIYFIRNEITDNNNIQYCGENYCVTYTDYTLKFYGEKLLSLNESLKYVNCTNVYLYKCQEQNIDNTEIHIHLLTIDKQYFHYKFKSDVTLIKTIKNVNFVNVSTHRQDIIRYNDEPLYFRYNSPIPETKQMLAHIYKCALRCYPSLNSVRACISILLPNTTISYMIFEDGFVFAICGLENKRMYDCIHITDNTRPFTKSILL